MVVKTGNQTDTTMNKILATAFAAAALLSVASCQKMELENTGNEPAQTVRIISGEFANAGTKTTLDTDGLTPLWSAEDVIRVLDDSGYQDITLVANGSTPGSNEGEISADSKSFSFATTLSGTTLYAIYPASATTMTSCTDGNISFTIPSVQDGKFGSANICVASGDSSTPSTLYFSNATAVVEMTVATGVEYVNLTAANKIAGDMTVAMGSKGAISSTASSSLSSNYIFVSGSSPDSKFYMAVAPVETGEVTVTCNTSDKSGSVDKGTKTLAKDKIYEMDLSGMTIATEDLTGQHGVQNGVEYVIIKAKYDGTNDSYLKWATQNLAVTESGKAKWNGTNYVIGDYFQWAASYGGYGITVASFKTPENLVIYDSFTNTCAGGSSYSFTFKTGKTSGFRLANSPYSNGTDYTKYTDIHTGGDGITNLEQSDDVARIVLGGSWRMPTGGGAGEFKAMRAATYWAWDDTDKGYYVFKPGYGTSGSANGNGDIAGTDDKTKALLFFPAGGNGNGTNLVDAGSRGYYWSSTFGSDSTGYAFSQSFNPSDVHPEGSDARCLGFSVRPVSD